MDISYLYFTFSGVFNAVVSTLLGLLVYFKDPRSQVNKTLSLFCFGVAMWSYAYIFWPLSQTAEETLLYFQLLHIGACFVSIFYLHFVVIWLNLYQAQKKIIIFGYLTSAIFSLLVFSPHFIKGMVPKFSMYFWAEPGVLYHFYLLNFFGWFFYSCYLLLKHLRQAEGVKKMQIKLILLGMALSFLGGSTNYFLWYNINIPPYGNILASSFVIFSAYAIIRYKFLDIRVIATEAALLVMNILLFFRFIISSSLMEWIINSVTLVGLLFLSLVLLRSVKREIRRREEIQKLAADLKAVNEKLVELDKAKSEFLSIASHQLRTPLTIIKGYISMIQDGDYGPVPNPKIGEVLSNVYQSNEHLIHLVNDFLDVSRIDAGRTEYKFEKVDLKDILEEVVKQNANRIKEKGLKLKLAIAKNLPRITADVEKIHHAVFNFLSNSIKYTDKGFIKTELFRDGNWLVCQISDSGIGLSPADKENLFQKFYRSENAQQKLVEGVGLGLFVCRKLIEGHRGEVFAESPGVGKGSTFGFRLPIK